MHVGIAALRHGIAALAQRERTQRGSLMFFRSEYTIDILNRESDKTIRISRNAVSMAVSGEPGPKVGELPGGGKEGASMLTGNEPGRMAG